MALNFDAAQLRALAAVIGEGSFERAAIVLHITPSAVSQRIRALEEHVGRVLVRRTTPARATQDGQILVQLAQQAALLESEAARRMGLIDADMPQPRIPVAVNHDSLETRFVAAAEAFSQGGPTTLELLSDDQDHTADLLRSGAVLGAVTTSAEPVQGCRSYSLGYMRYAATCSPDFYDRHFSRGITAQSLDRAPVLVFNHKDQLQARFAARVIGNLAWRPPMWWLPSARAFVEATVRGLGWTMNPLLMVQGHLDAGQLVMIKPRAFEKVPLYWQHRRMDAAVMTRLTQAILAHASQSLIKPRVAPEPITH
jgi:LysR family transcriptional regulator (chromosome initiation inhibitor)